MRMAQQKRPPRSGPAPQGWSTGAQPLTRRLQRLTERLRAFDRRRPLVWDLHITGVFVFAALVDAAGGWRNVAFNDEVPSWLVLAMSLGFSVPLLWRRGHPLAVLLVMLPFSLANAACGAHLQASFLQMIAVYNIALRLPLRTLLWSFGAVLVPLAVGATAYPVGSWDQQFVPMLYSFALVALLGLAVRSRQEYTASLVERARQLEVERDQQARLAAAAERTRIAREMHDIIGHNLSVITGLADGGAYAAAGAPERAAQALEAIGTTSRQALTELRRLLDVLREDTEAPPAADLAPQPALTDLGRLVDGVRGAGLPVDLTVEGAPGPLPAGRQLTVYRVVQEALTNSLKHGGRKATACVAVRYAADGVSVTVTDTGTGGDAASTGTGRGLAGMRERTAMYDGTLEAGPLHRPPGGWRVRLHLPKEPDQ
ncbi:sensor histidine kinase [Streptomyces sp. Tu 2975]|uniref:sensor histidine kinase n=1 Tax=Streptomyces sp. Tu 2975 TaxID=2676871 RepID=UPI00135B79BA|nr:sensor histidine kinase [Streptomyces sp. Tu 2975]QIP85761.1 sensor histidine kinase [Streptomyces sp. Tu 2975]